MDSIENTDNRNSERIHHAAIIRYYNGDEDEYRTAHLYNYSQTGFYLELKFPPPKLGANLLIEVLDEGADNTELATTTLSPKTCYYAKVIWKKNLPDSSCADYGVGLSCLNAEFVEN